MIQVDHLPRQVALSGALMVATGLLQASGMVLVSGLVDRGTAWVQERATGLRHLAVMSVLMVCLFAIHLLQMSLWAGAYWLAQDYTSFALALYDSAICFTTLDVPGLPLGWRFLPAAEGLTGMLMFAWSAGAMFSVFSTLTAARRDFWRQRRARARPPPPA
jgi:hypothetical protein